MKEGKRRREKSTAISMISNCPCCKQKKLLAWSIQGHGIDLSPQTTAGIHSNQIRISITENVSGEEKMAAIKFKVMHAYFYYWMTGDHTSLQKPN